MESTYELQATTSSDPLHQVPTFYLLPTYLGTLNVRGNRYVPECTFLDIEATHPTTAAPTVPPYHIYLPPPASLYLIYLPHYMSYLTKGN